MREGTPILSCALVDVNAYGSTVRAARRLRASFTKVKRRAAGAPGLLPILAAPTDVPLQFTRSMTTSSRALPLLITLTATALLATVSRAEDATPIKLPALHVGDHAHYLDHFCRTKTIDDGGRGQRALPTSCEDSTFDVVVLRVDADGGVRERYTGANGTRTVTPERFNELSIFVGDALQHGVPVVLDIDPAGKPIALGDAAALRAGLKRYLAAAGAASARLKPDVVQRASKMVEGAPDAQLLAAVTGSAKLLLGWQPVALVPGATTDGVSALSGGFPPSNLEAAHHTEVSALSDDGKALRITVSDVVDGERAKAMLATIAEAARSSGRKMTPRDEAEFAELQASPPTVRAVTVTRIDPHAPWPSTIESTTDIGGPHESEHTQTTLTRE